MRLELQKAPKSSGEEPLANVNQRGIDTHQEEREERTQEQVSHPRTIPWANRIITVERSINQPFQKQRIAVTQSWTKETFQELYFATKEEKILSKSSHAGENFEFAR